MRWNVINLAENIKQLNELYGDFEDSTLVKFYFESGNYVDNQLVSHEYDLNDLYLLFERMDKNPFSIELKFEHVRRFNFFAPNGIEDNWMSEILFAKSVRNDDYIYWTKWKDFDPYNQEHLQYNDFMMIECYTVKWRVVS